MRVLNYGGGYFQNEKSFHFVQLVPVIGTHVSVLSGPVSAATLVPANWDGDGYLSTDAHGVNTLYAREQKPAIRHRTGRMCRYPMVLIP